MPSSSSWLLNTKIGDGPKSCFRYRPGLQVSFGLNLQMNPPKYFNTGQSCTFETNLLVWLLPVILFTLQRDLRAHETPLRWNQAVGCIPTVNDYRTLPNVKQTHEDA